MSPWWFRILGFQNRNRVLRARESSCPNLHTRSPDLGHRCSDPSPVFVCMCKRANIVMTYMHVHVHVVTTINLRGKPHIIPWVIHVEHAECTLKPRSNLRAHKFQNLSGGAYPPTPKGTWLCAYHFPHPPPNFFI